MLHAAPNRCCFFLKPRKKTLSSKYLKDSGPELSRIQTSIFHWQRFGTAWLKTLPSAQLVLAAELDPCRRWGAWTINPNNALFFLWRTENLAVALCLLGFCLLLQQS